MSSPATLAVTLGDPRGIGPEVMLAAGRSLLERAPDVRLRIFGTVENVAPETLSALEEDPRVEFRGVGEFDGGELSAGRISLDAIEAAVASCYERESQALVTGPVHKRALWTAGLRFPGQTEFLQSLTDAPSVGMLMASRKCLLGSPLRVLLATTHIPLRSVPDAVTGTLLAAQTLLLDEALRDQWGIPEPRIALCALNPHASDGGLFGDEEARVMEPAVAALASSGVDVVGPVPADTVFLRAGSGEFDAVVAPYHDVGMAPFKSLAFGGGVNTTLGLPFPRTSPDHGTAMELVGTGKARPDSAMEAMELGLSLARGTTGLRGPRHVE